MENLKVFGSYEQFKQEFDYEVRSHAEGYIRMGYLLRRAEDTDVLYGSGYKSVAEFAWNEYHLKDDVVSKMIAINKRYSEDGYSDRISEKYRGFGASLLAEMLTLSDAVIEALPDSTTRETIREVKHEIAEESKITPIEVMMEEPEPVELGSNLEKVLHKHYQDNSYGYRELHKAVKNGMDRETAMHLLAPSGVGVKIERVAGVGKFMLTIDGLENPLELVNVRTNETEQYSWDECVGALQSLCTEKTWEKNRELLYGEKQWAENPETQAITGVAGTFAQERTPDVENRQERGGKSPETQVTTGVAADFAPAQEAQKAEEAEMEKQGQQETKQQEGTGQQETEWLQGEPRQASIEDMPEVLPDGYIRSHAGVEVETERPKEEMEDGELWAVAAEIAEKINNTTQLGWNPDAVKVMIELHAAAEELTDILRMLVKRNGVTE